MRSSARTPSAALSPRSPFRQSTETRTQSSTSPMTPRGVMGGARSSRTNSISPTRSSVSRSSSLERVARASPSGREALQDAMKYKQRREQVAREARLKKEAEEISSCTFKPSLDPRSERLVERGAGADKPALHEPRMRQPGVDGEDSFNTSVNGGSARPSPAPSPRIDPVSRALANMAGRTGPVHERLLGSGEETSAKIAEMQDLKAAKEEADLSFKPQINTRSQHMHRDKHGQSAVERLTSGYAKQKAEHFEQLKKEAEEKLNASITQVKYLNETSKRILSTPKTSRASSIVDFALGTHYSSSQSSAISSPRGFHTPRTGLTPQQSPAPRASRHYTPKPSPLHGYHQPPLTPQVTPLGRHKSPTNQVRSPSNGIPHSAAHPVPEHSYSPSSQNSSGLALVSPEGVGGGEGSSPMANGVGGKRGGTGDADIAAEIERMRLEFARVVKEKEAEAMKKMESVQRAATMVDVGWKENESLKAEVERLTQTNSSLDSQLSRALARAAEAERERDEARKQCETMRGDLDSITAKGQAVVRLNSQLMAQIKELSGTKLQQQQHSPTSPLYPTEDVIGSASPSPTKSQQNGIHGSSSEASPPARGRLHARAGRMRGRLASDSEDSLSSLDDGDDE